jgi:phosphatidylglycerophosphate synthase
MIRRYIGDRTETALSSLARLIQRRGVSPNFITLAGLAMNLGAAGAYAAGAWVAAGVIVLLAGFFDMLDGAVARAGGRASAVGGFTDSVADRYSDGIVFGGLVLHFAARGDVKGSLLVLVALIGAYQVSYVRARAELVIPRCDVGLMERAERLILLAAGSLFGFLETALWLLAILTHLTALHRIYFTVTSVRRADHPVKTHEDVDP